jgi:hypothetical protein
MRGMREMFMHCGLWGQKIHKREKFEGYKEVVRRCKVYCIHIGYINPLNAELNPICHLLALLGAHHILHISRIRVKKT